VSSLIVRLGLKRTNPEYGRKYSGSDVPTSNSLIEEFTSSEFTKEISQEQEEKNVYKLSAAIAEKLFEDDTFDAYSTLVLQCVPTETTWLSSHRL